MYPSVARCHLWVALALLLGMAGSARAIMTLGGSGRLTTPPTGEWANSGWDLQGKWGSFVGTPIGPHHFITAMHVGGGVGQIFTFDNKPYTAEEVMYVPETDLAVWRVRETLPRYATLYTGNSEARKPVIVFGRGVRRGKPVIVEGETRGWFWGAQDASLSWGTNIIQGSGKMPGASDMLAFGFDAKGGPNVGFPASGDSGGGVFLRDTDGTWKLCGINFGVSAQYSRTADGKGLFFATLFDARGLYQKEGDGLTLIPLYGGEPQSSTALATRISTYAPDIYQITGGTSPVPAAYPLTTRQIGLILIAVFVVVWWIGTVLYYRRKRARNRAVGRFR